MDAAGHLYDTSTRESGKSADPTFSMQREGSRARLSLGQLGRRHLSRAFQSASDSATINSVSKVSEDQPFSLVFTRCCQSDHVLNKAPMIESH